MINLTKKIILAVLFLNIASCSKNNDEIDGLIKVFSDNNKIQVDTKLNKEKLILPKIINNKYWLGSNKFYNNYDIENYALSPKFKPKKSIWVSGNFLKNYNKNSSPIFVKNNIYFLTNDGYLIAINSSNHEVIYKKRIIANKSFDDFSGGKIFYSDNKIYITTGFNEIISINIKLGEVIWSKKTSSNITSTPIIHDEQVFFTTIDNQTYSLNANNGQINWIHEAVNRNTSIIGSSDPVIYKDNIIASYSSGEIYLLNQKNGQAIWGKTLNTNLAVDSDFILNDIDSTPIVKDEVVYAIGNGGLMMAVSMDNGAVIWQKKLASITNFWIAGDYIYLIDNNKNLISISKNHGKIKWYRNLSDEKYSKYINYRSIIMAQNNLIITNDRDLLVISPHNGDLIRKFKVSGNINNSPIIVDNKLYVVSKSRFINRLNIFY